MDDSQEESETNVSTSRQIYDTQDESAKGIEEGVVLGADDVMCTESHVIERTTEDDDPGNKDTETSPPNNVEMHKEAHNGDYMDIATAHHDTARLAEQENEQMETSRPPESLLDISSTPLMVAHATIAFIGQQSNNFLKGCKWAPDGSCVLTCSDDNILRIFNLPPSLYNNINQCCDEEMQCVRWIKEGETIYDYCWYPLMTSFDAATCCLASTSKDGPVHLWDGFNGSLRCTYIPHNHLDELVTAYSLGFTRDGSQLMCGFPKCIRVFNTAVPGKQCQVISTHGKSRLGQTGIISSFAFHPTIDNIIAAGSYSGSVGVYSLDSSELLFLVKGHSGGITHLVFSANGNYLYSGGRKDPDITCWDMRNPGKVLLRMKRNVETNQRMYFDLDSADQYLVSGNHSGDVSIWDTRCTANEEATLDTSLSFQAHKDCVNGISLHPSLPLLATSSGQRKFPLKTLLDCSDEEEDSDYNDNMQENCLKLWSLSGQQYLNIDQICTSPKS